SLNPDNKLQLKTFQDRANDETSPLPADEDAAAGNFKQDSGFLGGAARNEPTLGDVVLPSTVAVWKEGGTTYDLTDGVAFDDYAGDTTLKDRIAFLPTGGIAPPEDTANSGLPTVNGGRGVYFADMSGKNYFRVTVDSDLSGRLRVDKWQAGTGYCSNQAGLGSCPNGWTWY
ncbi:MAG: hypothetical protein ABI610_09015, partial [Acidobacteriota bacterium]